MSYSKILDDELKAAGLDPSSSDRFRLARYCQELDHWNSTVNLTGLSGSDLVRRLVVIPVWLANELKLDGRLADIGSGNGSPAIPFCVSRPLQVAHLIERRSRRAAFLRQCIAVLSLDRVIVHKDSLSDCGSAVGKVDWISLQGVRLSPGLIDEMRPIASPSTHVLWVTSETIDTHNLPVYQRIETPFSNTQALVFAMDQS